MSKVQEGDIWQDGEDEYNVTKVTDTHLAYWYFDDEGDLTGEHSSIEHFLRDNILIERDGKIVKPARVFEEGAWYPVRDSDNTYPAIFRDGWFLAGTASYTPEVFQEIGEKLEFKLNKGK